MCGHAPKLVARFVNFGKSGIHGFSDLVRAPARKVFPQRVAEKPAAGAFRTSRQSLRFMEDVVGNGYSGFNTKSITREKPLGNCLPGNRFGDVEFCGVAVMQKAADG